MSKENSMADVRALVEQAHVLLGRVLIALGEEPPTTGRLKRRSSAPVKAAAYSVDFDTPFRAFVKQHASGMSGARKFTLLAAYISKGDVKKSVDLAEIKQHWSKVKAKGLLGMDFNPKYTSEAKEHDRVDASAGAYVLRPSWKDIFE